MLTQAPLLYVLIVGCEVAFWLILLASLVVRYLLRRERLSKWLLLSLPVIDLLLLVFTLLDLRAGATPTFAHGLAAAYVGFTIMFGGITVRWADAQFAFRYAGGPRPPKVPTRGWEVVRFDFMLWFRSIGAWTIALALITAAIAYVNTTAVTEALDAWYRYAFGSVVLWFIFGPVWSLLILRREVP